MQRIYFYIKVGFGNGFGHFQRCLSLSSYLTHYKISFFLQGDISPLMEESLLSDSISFYKVKKDKDVIPFLKQENVSLLVHDARDSSAYFIKKASSFTKVLSLDDNGKGSLWSRATINALPVVHSVPKANFSGIDYLILDKRLYALKDNLTAGFINSSTSSPSNPSLLVSFGGEDPFSLTSFFYEILEKLQIELSFSTKIVLGPLYKGKRDFPKAKVLHSLSYDDFIKELSLSDFVITSFGMTVYEALFLSKAVFTINPTPYHSNLSKLCPYIVDIGYAGKKDMLSIKEKCHRHFSLFINSLSDSSKSSSPFASYNNGAFLVSKIIDRLSHSKIDACPVCGSSALVYLRDLWTNYYYCSCHSFYRSLDYSYREEYKDEYFTKEYKAQYGKTYLEDKASINELNRARLKVIDSLIEKSSAIRLLELGCAVGFFLEKARSLGYMAYGVEFSSYASLYAQGELNLDVLHGSFSDLSLEELSFGLDCDKEVYDVVCAWYFIEHNRDFRFVLEKMSMLLKRGGLLCLSTPNAHGVSLLSDRLSYIKKIPKDHFVEFSPSSLSKLLESLGFDIEKIVIKGLYLNRIIKGSKLRSMLGLFRGLILWYYKNRHLGDTFEIYARKR